MASKEAVDAAQFTLLQKTRLNWVRDGKCDEETRDHAINALAEAFDVYAAIGAAKGYSKNLRRLLTAMMDMMLPCKYDECPRGHRSCERCEVLHQARDFLAFLPERVRKPMAPKSSKRLQNR